VFAGIGGLGVLLMQADDYKKAEGLSIIEAEVKYLGPERVL
jgi:hypothetical protein